MNYKIKVKIYDIFYQAPKKWNVKISRKSMINVQKIKDNFEKCEFLFITSETKFQMVLRCLVPEKPVDMVWKDISIRKIRRCHVARADWDGFIQLTADKLFPDENSD